MYIKGFDKKLRCRGFQFKVGGVYDTGAKDDNLKLCSNTVFHFCDSIEKVHKFYNCSGDNRYCEIEVLGGLVSDNVKCGSNRIRIVREITGEELNIAKGLINGNTGLFNSGNRNSGDRNSGNRNSGNSNSGYSNSGNYCSGNYCSGNYNSGNCNSGYSNSGNRNSGDYNSGDYNSGDYNSADGCNGFFCTKDPEVYIFNKPSGMTQKEFRNSKYYNALISSDFMLSEWIRYTEEEMTQDSDKELTEGYLKTYSYMEACTNWWANMTEENRKIVMKIPNFDPDIFKEITGIDVNN